MIIEGTNVDLAQKPSFCQTPVSRSSLYVGMPVVDSEGQRGIIRSCNDLHNVHVTFEGEGITIDWYGEPFECGGSGLYCFVEGCEENDELIYPLYCVIT